MNDHYTPAGILSCVLTLATHTGFTIRLRDEYVTEADSTRVLNAESPLETFLDFEVTDGELKFVFTQSTSDVLADPITTLVRLGKVAAALTEFTFGE